MNASLLLLVVVSSLSSLLLLVVNGEQYDEPKAINWHSSPLPLSSSLSPSSSSSSTSAINNNQYDLSTLARGFSHYNNRLSEARIWHSNAPRSRVLFESQLDQPTQQLRRSKRFTIEFVAAPPPPTVPPLQQANYPQAERRGQYGGHGYGASYGAGYGSDCQYHTLVNGDSEIILRKLLPLRLVGRTIVRHCIEKPNLNDPRYKVLLKGNQKSSFGSVRLQMVQ